MPKPKIDKTKVPRRRYKRRQKSIAKSRASSDANYYLKHQLDKYLGEDGLNEYNVLMTFLPKNLKYLITCEQSHLYIWNLIDRVTPFSGKYTVPKRLSLIDNPDETYNFLADLTAGLILQKSESITLDYSTCVYVGLEAQIYLDIILKDIISFYKRCNKYPQLQTRVRQIGGRNVKNKEVEKMLFSVGSPAIHSNISFKYPDIISYKLCVHNSLSKHRRNINRKDIDTSALAEYVVSCLARLNKTLTPDKLNDLCIVISEILINAEEHSTNKYRFSVGYFTETKGNGEHYGIFRLVILNFGQTIYEKFKDPNCPNKDSVAKMKTISDQYTKKRLFRKNEFEEETLWTLYSLQEGITSVDPTEYQQRGNGSIQFIEKFFNIKGEKKLKDDISQLILMSGNTKIVFDGTYNIVTNISKDEKFQYMTFNESGNIMDKPDSKFVTFANNYFSGTLISAEILINEDDIETDYES